MRSVPRSVAALILTATLAATALTAASSPAEAAVAGAGDGTTPATAGASCWGIKQQYPSSADGTYWLVTTALGGPQQFACDMTTDDGGWVLVGRGRQGWNFTTALSQGTASAVRTTTGPSAFAPAYLPVRTVNGLLDGATVSSLPDGIRLRRAKDVAGTQWQEVRLRPATPQGWTWALDNQIALSSTTVDGTTYRGGNTRDTLDASGGAGAVNDLAGANDDRRVFTWKWSGHANQAGFSYGQTVAGSSSSTSYLWASSGENHAIPFTQVWLRPQLPNSSVPSTPIPAGGFGAETFADLKSKAEPNPWGVSGNDRTNDTTQIPYPQDSVLAVKAIGDRVYVGGRFTTVRNAAGSETHTQRFLAAFDRATGTWLPGFAPTLDGQVYALSATPDGKLLVGGNFSNVNGAAGTSALALLDPATGAVVPGWKASLTSSTTVRPIVRALDVSNGWVYAAGRFNKLTGGTWGTITVSGLAKVSLANGTPASGFSAIVPAAPNHIDVSDDGTRLYLAGSFTSVNNDPNAAYAAILNSSNGSVVQGVGPFLPSTANANYKLQHVTMEYRGKLFIGGSQHDFQMYDRDRQVLQRAHITRSGGDMQAIGALDGYVYSGCHCWNSSYEDTNNFDDGNTPYTNRYNVNGMMRYDAATGRLDPNWYPSGIHSTNGDSVWTYDADRAGCLWFGGDVRQIGWSGTTADWAGNFGRFCPSDNTAPATPANVTAKLSGTSATITWSAAGDDSGAASLYWVYRNDRVVGVTYGTSFVDTGLSGTNRYAVRAVDPSGNRSASLAPVSVTVPPATVGTLVAKGATWRYQDSGAAPAADWTANGFDDSAWPSGAAVLGWGKTQATTIGASRPVTTYFRRTFTVDDPSAIGSLVVGARVDDGAAVTVNGVEVARVNLPTGTLTASTLATAFTSGTQETTYRSFTVPASMLVAGTNTVAVEVHQAQVANADAIFDLELVALGR